jgi:uncharacterized membrane protein
MIAAAPAQANAKLQQFTASMGGSTQIAAPATAGPARGTSTADQRAPAPDAASQAKRNIPDSQHFAGIARHLEKGLTYLKDHWWEELKKVGWNLLWPWPAVWGDLKGIWAEVKATFQDAYQLHVSKVIDHVLAIDQKLNSILGNLYGWFFIASVLVGAIAGAIPGALAGAAFAGEVGEALVAALIATETAVIVKGLADLAIGHDTDKEDEADYDKIAGSTMTIAVTGAMMLLGELAAKLAKSIWEGVAGVFKGEKAPEVEVGTEQGKPVETPKDGGDKPQPTPGSADNLAICRVCDIVPGVPKDLMEQRANLPKEVRDFLDSRVARFFPDPSTPTLENFKALRGFMENATRKGGGNLEAGLRQMMPTPPPVHPPFGPMIGELPRLRTEVEQLIADIEDFVASNPKKETIRNSAGRLNDQIAPEGPVTEMEQGRREATPEQVNSVERAIKGARSEFDSAKVAPDDTQFGVFFDGIEFDEIRPDGTIVQRKSIRALRQGSRTYNETVAQVRRSLEIAQKYPVNGQPRQVIMEFPEGLSADVDADLKAININGQQATINGPIIVLPPK